MPRASRRVGTQVEPDRRRAPRRPVSTTEVGCSTRKTRSERDALRASEWHLRNDLADVREQLDVSRMLVRQLRVALAREREDKRACEATLVKEREDKRACEATLAKEREDKKTHHAALVEALAAFNGLLSES